MQSNFTYVQDVKLFHDRFGLATPDSFTRLPDDLHAFRSGFFREELQEYEDAAREGDLGTTLDSLIDLVYIISGAALLHGIQHEELYATMSVADEFARDDALLPSELVDYDLNGSIVLPDPLVAGVFTTMMSDLIDTYNAIHEDAELTLVARREYVKFVLATMFLNCLQAAGYQGCTDELWNELWADVQRANMSKERALKAGDSKRGSTWDVVKPVGWVGPQTDAIIAKHQPAA